VPVRALSRLNRNSRHRRELVALRGAATVCVALFCAHAVADQLSGSLSVVSDYRYRGVSLSGNDPAAQASINYDDTSGLYAGAFVSTARFAFESSREVQAISFVGYAWRLPSGVSGEVGADYALFTRTHDYDYPEIYGGFASGIWSGRLYFAPRYFGRDGNAVYGEVNAAQPLSDRFRVIAHGGVLWSKGGNPYYESSDRATFDVRIGVGIDLDRFGVELSWVGLSNTRSAYPFAGNGRRNGPVVALTLAF
jgi:uncharacterized protein (TIGR02001 family)